MKTEDDGKGKVKKTRGCFLVFGALFVSFLLVSIYLPSYISYREMTFCTKAESDANAVAAAIADYFSDPNHTATPTLDQLKNWTSVTLSGKNTATVTGADPNVHITITVTDASGKCPADYQAASDDWDGNNVYILTLTQ
jgi:Tfp pilus assembly protein PilE